MIFEGEYLNGKKWNGKVYSWSKVKLYEIKEGNRYKIESKESKDILYNHLIFEGEFLNGKKSGYGKEYGYYKEKNEMNNNNHLLGIIPSNRFFLKFEGEYLFDYKQKGKEYFRNYKLEFEGKYALNKKWEGKGYDENVNILNELHNGNGKVKEYNNKGILIFDEEYLNGEKNNIGKEYIDERELIYEGEYLNRKKNAKGKDNNNSIIFEGEYINGKRWNGMGKIFDKNKKIIIEGNLIEGKLNGKVNEYYRDGIIKFKGEYKDGKRNEKEANEYDHFGKLIFE